MMELPNCVRRAAASHRYPLLFATVSGAHLYGFPSPDSDYDLRGVHVLPVEAVVGLDTFDETIELSTVEEGTELDLVTHDVRKFFRLLLKKNGYVLEQLYSPLIVQSGAGHEELKSIARNCITRYHSHHYLGFAASQWKLFLHNQRVKPLLYVYRVLLTGIHLMRCAEIEANLIKLNEHFELPYIPDLIARKHAGPEKQALTDVDALAHEAEYKRLCGVLEDASEKCALPDLPTARPALNDLLTRLRLGRP